MKVLLTTGSPGPRLKETFNLLRQFGVATAEPTRKENLSPEALQEMLLRNCEVDLSLPGDLKQLEPGKLWHELAAHLFLENIEQPCWGWADPRSIVLLDFWADFDPQIRFLLVYETPHKHVARELGNSALCTSADVQAALGRWVVLNSALLSFYRRHDARCVLINADAALSQPGVLVELLRMKLGMETLVLHGVSDNFGRQERAEVCPYLEQHLSGLLVGSAHSAAPLAFDLDSSADIPPVKRKGKEESRPYALWGEWVAAKVQLTRSSDEEKRFQAERREYVVERDKFQNEIVRLSAEARAGAKAAELEQENRFLLIQLQQAQEELDQYCTRTLAKIEPVQPAEPDTKFEVEFWRQHQPDIINVDMRSEVAGSNWYYPEADGRCAGPATTATLQFPAIQAGEYELEVQVMDAMSAEIVEGMEISAFGQRRPVTVEPFVDQDDYPLLCLTTITIPATGKSEPWTMELHFPFVLSPAAEGDSDDNRFLAVRIYSLKLIKMS
jgi:hypothetical protein